MSLTVQTNLSFSKTLTTTQFFLTHKTLSLPPVKPTFIIRMGGGPRTYPGGVSKWQWKRMQAKKSKQLLQARLARERQIYDMRKRAELKAAVSELERPWEVVEKPPNLFSVSVDEQLKVLADRFQKPGGFDLWSENDGPQLFKTFEGIPSARFFPKGVVHSVKPYGINGGLGSESGTDEDGELGSENGIDEDGELGLENENEMSARRIRGGDLAFERENEDRMSTGRFHGRVRRGSDRSGGSERNGTGVRRTAGHSGGRSTFRSNGDSRMGRSDGRASLGDSTYEDGIDDDGALGPENEDKMSTGMFRGRGRRGRFRSYGAGGLEKSEGGTKRTVGRGGGRRSFGSNGDGRISRNADRPSLGDSKYKSKTNENSKLASENEEQLHTGRIRGRGRIHSGGRRNFRSNSDDRLGRREGRPSYSKPDVYDMSLQQDGSYGF